MAIRSSNINPNTGPDRRPDPNAVPKPQVPTPTPQQAPQLTPEEAYAIIRELQGLPPAPVGPVVQQPMPNFRPRVPGPFDPIPWEGESNDGYREAVGYDSFNNAELMADFAKMRQGLMNPSYNWQLEGEMKRRGLMPPTPIQPVAGFEPNPYPSERDLHPALFPMGWEPGDDLMDPRAIGNPWNHRVPRYKTGPVSPNEYGGQQFFGKPAVSELRFGPPASWDAGRLSNKPAYPWAVGRSDQSPSVKAEENDNDRDGGAGTRFGRGPNMDYGDGPLSDSEYGSPIRRPNRGMR